MKTMNEIKGLIKTNLGTPAHNQNAALALAGEEFTTKAGVTGRVLKDLSVRGKIQAELTCAHPGCTKLHIREQSDWHQSIFCREHAAAKKVNLTDEQKAANRVAKAQAIIDAFAKAQAAKTEALGTEE